MSLKNLYKGISIILLCLAFSMVYAQQQNKETLDDVSQRVKVLEGQKENLDKLIGIYEKQIEAKSKEMDEKIHLKEKELNLMTQEIKQVQKWNNWIVYIVAFIGVGSLASFFFGLKKYIEKKAKEYAEKLIKETYQKEEKTILETVRKQSEENILKHEKKILVLTPNGADDSFVRKFFGDQVMGFNRELVFYAIPDELKKIKNVDLVFFNNEEKGFDHKDILKIIEESKKDNVFFYFGPDRFESRDFKDRVNFANSRVQIYGNLINTLRYQKLLQ